MTTEQLLNQYPEETIQLALEAQALILQQLPAIVETTDEKAKIIGYGYSNKYIDNICTIILSKYGIKIGLNKGTEFPDPKGLLTGTGKVHKHVQITEMKDLKTPALKNLLKEGLRAWKNRTK